jgi:chromosome segregation ATPase
MERFNTERKELFVKIEQLNLTLTNKERELTVLKNKLETALEEADKKKKSVEDIKSEFNQEKLKLNEKIEQLRTKNQEITDEFMQKKLEDGREIALYRQKLEFQQKKIDDNQRQYDDLCTRYDERSTSLKQEYQ